MDTSKPIIIAGSGASVPFLNSRYNNGFKHGLEPKLEQIIKHNYSIGCNFFYKYGCETTFNCSGDYQFYLDNLEELKKIPMIIASEDPQLKNNKISRIHDNTILLKHSHIYNGLNSWKLGFFSRQLIGIFCLSIAIALGFKEIYLCYDKETEVFTNEGWKYFKDLTGKERVLTRKAGGNTQWSDIIALQKYKYKGIMKHIKQRGIDLLVTPDHPFYLESFQNYNDSNCKYFPIEKDGYIHRTVSEFNTTDYKIPKIFNWKGKNLQYFVLPAIKGKWMCQWNYDKNIQLKIMPWLKFLGLYISEGCLSNYKKIQSYRITIYQNHTSEKDKYIENILKQLPFNYRKTKRGWDICNKQLYTYLENNIGMNCYKKNIPIDIKNLSSRNLNYLLEGLIFGDGCKGKQEELYYFTASKQLADDVQEIAYKCGYYAGINKRNRGEMNILGRIYNTATQWSVYFNKSVKQGNLNYISMRNLVFNNKIQDVEYNNDVYDLTAKKNHVIWVRRNNQCVWSGNCGYDACEIDGQTHFYQGVVDLNKHTDVYVKGQLKDKRFKFRGVGKNQKGDYKTSTYNHPEHINKKWYKPFVDEKNINIYNVSTESAINVFPKITYDEFYKQMENYGHVWQKEAREEIKQFILEKLKL